MPQLQNKQTRPGDKRKTVVSSTIKYIIIIIRLIIYWTPDKNHQLKGPKPSILVVLLHHKSKPMIPKTDFHSITTWVARNSG